MTLSVHPRLRGELFARKGDEIGYTGSSPLTRGTRAAHRIKNRFHRFIPAYAGNSRGRLLRILLLSGSSPLTRGTLTCKLTEGQYIAVHPRLRGELTRLFSASSEAVGSSPLTRGTHTIQGPLTVTGRFIPAYAGNSALACSRRARRSVHPRLRGELILVLRPALIHIGSSPLTRGTHSVPGLVDHF